MVSQVRTIPVVFVSFTVALGAVGFSAGLQVGNAGTEVSQPQETTPGVEARADRILREMGEYLASAGEFTFRADVTYDSVLTTGQKIEYGGTADVAVRRPDQLRSDYNGDERQSQAVYDGQTITLYDMAVNVYAVAEVPPEIDAAVDQVFESYGFSVPIADLVYSDPYRVLIEYVESGFWVGRHSVDGTPCHHLAFSQDSIDWQIWIEDGPWPVPRKLVITYKQEAGAPKPKNACLGLKRFLVHSPPCENTKSS